MWLHRATLHQVYALVDLNVSAQPVAGPLSVEQKEPISILTYEDISDASEEKEEELINWLLRSPLPGLSLGGILRMEEDLTTEIGFLGFQQLIWNLFFALLSPMELNALVLNSWKC